MVISLCFKSRGWSDSLYMLTRSETFLYIYAFPMPAEMKEPDTDEFIIM